jgi:hypothetical protein
MHCFRRWSYSETSGSCFLFCCSFAFYSFGLLNALRWARPFIRGLAEPPTFFGVMGKLVSIKPTKEEIGSLKDVTINLNRLETTSRRTGESQVERDTRDMNSVLFHGSLCVSLPGENLSPDLDAETEKLITVEVDATVDSELRVFHYGELFELQDRLQLMGGSSEVVERFIHKLGMFFLLFFSGSHQKLLVVWPPFTSTRPSSFHASEV